MLDEVLLADVTGEDFITRLAPLLLDALARNPGLAAFITATDAT